MPSRKLIVSPFLSWPANAGHPGGALLMVKKNLGGPVKPGHDKFWVGAR